ncbi:MAG TPA: DUF3006 domain-containing protein [Longimicrobium sp.]|jgi:hypothetical protein|uniref:DUF3006 domain-containing protein n=1 Tax=Longimicrobium sp. TaxID=2029185 RepID=UPI002EDB3333
MRGTERTWNVDAVEDGLAAVDGGGEPRAHLPAWLLPPEAREGDVLRVEHTVELDGSVIVRIRLDRAASEQARQQSRELLGRAAETDDGGDLYV